MSVSVEGIKVQKVWMKEWKFKRFEWKNWKCKDFFFAREIQENNKKNIYV